MTTEEQKQMVHQLVEEMLTDPSVKVNIRAEMRDTTQPEDTWCSFTKGPGRTLTISIQGGAKDDGPFCPQCGFPVLCKDRR